MPKFSQEGIEARPQVQADAPQQYRQEVTATPVDTFVRPAESDLMRLTQSLQQFMPAANQFLDAKDSEDKEDQRMQGYVAGKRGEIASTLSTPWFKNGYIQGTWENQAIQSSDDALKEFQLNKDNPSFDLRTFLQNKMAQDLQGVSNPTALKAYAERYSQMMAGLQHEMVQHQVEQTMLQRDQNANVELSDLVDRLSNPDNPNKLDHTSFISAYKQLTDKYAQQSVTGPEMAAKLFASINEASRRANGNPELFSVFDEPIPGTNLSLAQMNPKLGEQIEQAKYQQSMFYDHNMAKAHRLQNEDWMADFLTRLKSDPTSITENDWKEARKPYGPMGYMGPYEGHYPTLYAEWQMNKQLQADAAKATQDIANGNGWLYKDADVKKHLEAQLAPDIAVLANNLNNPKAFVKDAKGNVIGGPASAALKNLVVGMTATRTNVVLDEVTNMTGSVGLYSPDPKATSVPAWFNNLHTLYRQLSSSSNPALASVIFKDPNSRSIMENYDYFRKNGLDEVSAFQKAYYWTSPEGKKQAEETFRRPDVQKKIWDAVKGANTGFFANLAGIKQVSVFGHKLMEGFFPHNDDIKDQPALEEARKIYMSNPNLSMDEVADRVQKWAKNNYTYDSASNSVVRVQENTGALPQTAAAFASFTQGLQKVYGPDTRVSYNYRGNGHYSLDILDDTGAPLHRAYPDITHQQIMDAYKQKVSLVGNESKQFGLLEQKAANGNLTAADVNANAGLIAKVRRMGLMSDNLQNSLTALHSNASQELNALQLALREHGINSAGPISLNLARMPDVTTTKPVVQKFMQMGDIGGALTVAREGMALKAYRDPARGTDIGAGYNIESNARYAPEDFRRAGIPFPVQAIQSGKAVITPEQGMRLFQVVRDGYPGRPGYKDIARKAFESKYGAGAFNKLSSSEQAVLTDIAYQSGGNVAKYTDLFSHLISKENSKIDLGKAVSTSYRDATTLTNRVDTNGRNLRLSVLLGTFPTALRLSGAMK